jgi:hypothetical protein
MWTRRTLILLLLTSGCGGSQLTINLQGAPDLNGGTPAFLKFEVEKLADTKPKTFGPFDFKAVPPGNFAEVPPGTKFMIDVFGCPDSKAADCIDDQPDTLLARGCTDYFSITKDDGQEITIILHDPTLETGKCPPKKPA